MKMIKSLILGSAAGILAVGGAQAADLPVKAKAVEYVKVCSLYGAGYYYIPGTDTCIKIGGYLRAETSINGNSSTLVPRWGGDAGLGDRYADNFDTRGRLDLTVDTRTATEYGVVRTFGELIFTSTTYGGSTYNPTSLATNLGNNPTVGLDAAGAGTSYPLMLFMQFAGFTFGRAAPAYSSPWQGYIANSANGLIGGDNTGFAGVNNAQYTAQFGNGVSASVSIDDPSIATRQAIYNLSIPVGATGTASNAYAGVKMPDFDANIMIDQAWGQFELMGQVHAVDASFNSLAGSIPAGSVTPPTALTPADTVASTGLSSNSGHPDTAYGYAVSSSLRIRNVPTGAGDELKFQATYAKGDTHQVISPGSGAVGSFLMASGGGPGQAGAFGFGAATDAVYQPVGVLGSTDGSIHLTRAVGLVGAFQHNWNPQWNTSLYGSQSFVSYDATAKAEYCAAYAISVSNAAGTYTCNPNFTVSQIGTRTVWTPVAGLAFTSEVLWTHLGTGFSGFATTTPGSPLPTGVYQYKGASTVAALLRVQRNF